MFKVNIVSTYFEVLQQASIFLQENNQEKFAAEWLMRERLNWSKTELVRNYRENMKEIQIRQFEKDINQLSQGLPMQQIIGHDWFYNRKFKINSHTLIPRPETEEWLDRVLSILPKRPLRVLDIGTGSGVLAITDKLERPQDQVVATDISIEALRIAEENSQCLNAEVEFQQGDLFEPITGRKFDVILCNPPYISYEEINLMDKSVLEHEPQTALFAENQGLAIYERIAISVNEYINDKSCIFLEIGYNQGSQVREIFQKALPKAEIQIWKDFNNLDRVVVIYNS